MQVASLDFLRSLIWPKDSLHFFSNVCYLSFVKSNYLYGSAKAALTTYLSGLRNRLYKVNVHVLTVKPGFVNTKMTANIVLSSKLTAQPEEVAKEIYDAQNRKKDLLYTKWCWRWIMLIIKMIPENIFKKMNL